MRMLSAVNCLVGVLGFFSCFFFLFLLKGASIVSMGEMMLQQVPAAEDIRQRKTTTSIHVGAVALNLIELISEK